MTKLPNFINETWFFCVCVLSYVALMLNQIDQKEKLSILDFITDSM